ncbi:MAG: Flp pilus assembly complex ATPase component TadA [Planctomycetes bacterium]|nr:Flp pilus assembly complex ATPase component TadA [Planctomycetota bacterium]
MTDSDTTTARPTLHQLVVKHTGLDDNEVHKLTEQSISSGKSLDRVLLTRGVDDIKVLGAFGEHLNIELASDLTGTKVPAIFVDTVPLAFARAHDVIAIRTDSDGTIVVACAHPLDFHPQDDLAVMIPSSVRFVLAPRPEITELVNRAFRNRSDGVDDALDDLAEDDIMGLVADLDESEDLLDVANKAPIIKLVNSLIFQALKLRASDVHFQPYTDRMQVRFRIDGILYDMESIPKNAQDAITSRIKVMGQLDIAERRMPQDGRASVRIGDGEVDVRISVVPTAEGERCVLRLLDKSARVYELDSIGLDEENLKTLKHYVQFPHGIILVTGPTGSGKTTTLYGSLTAISTGEKNILTIEDPVEYQLDGISQVQVNSKKGLTFSAGLRSFLRQDPDVMMVGEIRDVETAEIAIRAAITGHLVFSTVHTNDAPSTVTRLIDLGLEPYLVSSSLVLVVAQRLVRRLCNSCCEWATPDQQQAAKLQAIGVKANDLKDGKMAVAKGCSECFHSGFSGRTALYELMPMTDDLRELVMNNESATILKRAAIAGGMRTLRSDGALKVIEGITSPDEVLRVTQLDIT